jgi:hypothetical protein
MEPRRVERCRRGVQRRLLRLLGVLFFLVLIAAGVPPGHVSAGGWAVTTLDSTPVARVGDVVPVGFVIRQHGVTPVHLDGEVGIEVRSPSGSVEFFAASPSGPVGHYVADVVFREAGAVTWSVHQGWFGPQELGVIAVAKDAGSGSVSRHHWPDVVRLGLPVLALGAAAVAVGDVVRSRSRRRVTA